MSYSEENITIQSADVEYSSRSRRRAQDEPADEPGARKRRNPAVPLPGVRASEQPAQDEQEDEPRKRGRRMQAGPCEDEQEGRAEIEADDVAGEDDMRSDGKEYQDDVNYRRRSARTGAQKRVRARDERAGDDYVDDDYANEDYANEDYAGEDYTGRRRDVRPRARHAQPAKSRGPVRREEEYEGYQDGYYDEDAEPEHRPRNRFMAWLESLRIVEELPEDGEEYADGDEGYEDAPRSPGDGQGQRQAREMRGVPVPTGRQRRVRGEDYGEEDEGDFRDERLERMRARRLSGYGDEPYDERDMDEEDAYETYADEQGEYEERPSERRRRTSRMDSQRRRDHDRDLDEASYEPSDAEDDSAACEVEPEASAKCTNDATAVDAAAERADSAVADETESAAPANDAADNPTEPDDALIADDEDVVPVRRRARRAPQNDKSAEPASAAQSQPADDAKRADAADDAQQQDDEQGETLEEQYINASLEEKRKMLFDHWREQFARNLVIPAKPEKLKAITGMVDGVLRACPDEYALGERWERIEELLDRYSSAVVAEYGYRSLLEEVQAEEKQRMFARPSGERAKAEQKPAAQTAAKSAAQNEPDDAQNSDERAPRRPSRASAVSYDEAADEGDYDDGEYERTSRMRRQRSEFDYEPERRRAGGFGSLMSKVKGLGSRDRYSEADDEPYEEPRGSRLRSMFRRGDVLDYSSDEPQLDERDQSDEYEQEEPERQDSAYARTESAVDRYSAHMRPATASAASAREDVRRDAGSYEAERQQDSYRHDDDSYAQQDNYRRDAGSYEAEYQQDSYRRDTDSYAQQDNYRRDADSYAQQDSYRRDADSYAQQDNYRRDAGSYEAERQQDSYRRDAHSYAQQDNYRRDAGSYEAERQQDSYRRDADSYAQQDGYRRDADSYAQQDNYRRDAGSYEAERQQDSYRRDINNDGYRRTESQYSAYEAERSPAMDRSVYDESNEEYTADRPDYSQDYADMDDGAYPSYGSAYGFGSEADYGYKSERGQAGVYAASAQNGGYGNGYGHNPARYDRGDDYAAEHRYENAQYARPNPAAMSGQEYGERGYRTRPQGGSTERYGEDQDDRWRRCSPTKDDRGEMGAPHGDTEDGRAGHTGGMRRMLNALGGAIFTCALADEEGGPGGDADGEHRSPGTDGDTQGNIEYGKSKAASADYDSAAKGDIDSRKRAPADAGGNPAADSAAQSRAGRRGSRGVKLGAPFSARPRRIWAMAGTLALMAALGAGAYAARVVYDVRRYDDAFYEGTYLDGVALQGMDMDEAVRSVDAANAERVSALHLSVKYGDERFDISSAELGARLDTREKLYELWKQGHEGGYAARYAQLTQLRREPMRLDTELSYDDTALDGFLDGIKKAVDKAPRDASIEFRPNAEDKFDITKSASGREVDIEALKADARAALEQGISDMELSPRKLEPDFTTEDARACTGKLVTYSTRISSSSSARTANIKLALGFYHGLRVEPGQRVDFNKLVGDRTEARGFRPAAEYSNGEIVQGIGGGVCQASTTLYGALLRAGLRIDERYNHSMTVGYVPRSQDAAVVYPGKTLTFTNDTGYPAFFTTRVTSEKATVTIYGYDIYPGRTISIESETLSVDEAKIKTYPDPTYQYASEPGQIVTVTTPSDGVTSRAYRVITDDKSGKVISRESLGKDTYRRRDGVRYRGGE
ncbi:MAG: VanW family protein [Candidatus Fimadaptatus sp.]|jgi:vancomycin resistance protein YoaR